MNLHQINSNLRLIAEDIYITDCRLMWENTFLEIEKVACVTVLKVSTESMVWTYSTIAPSLDLTNSAINVRFMMQIRCTSKSCNESNAP